MAMAGVQHRNLFQRLLGIPATRPPADSGGWTCLSGRIIINLKRMPELSRPNGAVRLESTNPPIQVLVFRDSRGGYQAVESRCPFDGQRLDPVPGTRMLQSCSVGGSSYDYDGNVLSGPARRRLRTFHIQQIRNKLIVTLI